MQDLTFFKGREAWVGDFLKMLPAQHSILRNYVWNASQITDANAGHHVGMGLILLTQVGPRYGVWLADKATLNNLFVLVTASSGARKSAALGIGTDVATAADLHSVRSTLPGSREGFIDTLDDNDPNATGYPRQALIYSEFADFLGMTAGASRGRSAGHAATLRGALMHAYDGRVMERELARSRDTTGVTTTTVRGTKHPVVSLIGAANYYVLSQHTNVNDWLNGFMGRFLMLDGELERYYFRQRPPPPGMTDVVNALRQRVEFESQRTFQQGPAYPPAANFDAYSDMYPDAYARVESWGLAMRQKQQQQDNELVATSMSRLMPLMLRVATILSYDYGEAAAAQPGWRLSLREIEPAIFLAERHLAAYQYAAANVVLNEEERPIRDVEQAIRKADNDNRMLTEGMISAAISRNDRSVTDALRTLLGRGVITKVASTNGMSGPIRYQLKDGLTTRIAYMPGHEPADVGGHLALFGGPPG